MQHLIEVMKADVHSGNSSASPGEAGVAAVASASALLNSAITGAATATNRRNPVCKTCGKLRKGHSKGPCTASSVPETENAVGSSQRPSSEDAEPEGDQPTLVPLVEGNTADDLDLNHQDGSEDVAGEPNVADDFVDDCEGWFPGQSNNDYTLKNTLNCPLGDWPFPLLRSEWVPIIHTGRRGIMWRRVFNNDTATEDFIFLRDCSYTCERRIHMNGVITEGGLFGIYADENEVAWYNR
ncbi:hypothetical protein PsorP6_004814 [Peronosclerospora sorghi]|uniref:Uncharacterized protein n=1 Tax=Peronosclerospora sorghi TaxID=230839 RepID=A0ACC0VPK4_9STRA|nr:hypothetical protein PsorP6_004814 [Peronosclerospora sorghi]